MTKNIDKPQSGDIYSNMKKTDQNSEPQTEPQDDSWFAEAATSRIARVRFDKNNSDISDQSLPSSDISSDNHKKQENPTHYAGHKEDRDYSYNDKNLHPKPEEPKKPPSEKSEGANQTQKIAEPQRLATADESSGQNYSAGDLSSRDYFDSSPAKQQLTHQEEGQGFKQGHDRSNKKASPSNHDDERNANGNPTNK